MKAEKVGCFYNRHGEIYRLISYKQQPIATLQNVETGDRITALVDSPVLSDFEEIVTKEKE